MLGSRVSSIWNPLPFLGCFLRYSHKPELWLPSNQNFPESLDFRHLQLDLLRHHGCLCHGDDVQLTCVGDTKHRCQDPESALVCKNSFILGKRLSPVTFIHGKGTRIRLHCKCVYVRKPFGYWETHFLWEPRYLLWQAEAQVGSPRPAQDYIGGLTAPACSSSWAFAPLDHGHFALSRPPRPSSTLDRRKFYNNYSIVILLLIIL